MSKTIFDKRYITEKQARAAADKAGIKAIEKEGNRWKLIENPESVNPRQEFEARIAALQADIEKAQTENEISNLYIDLNQLEDDGLAESIVTKLDEDIGIRAEEIEATQKVTGKPTQPKAEKEWIRTSSVLKPTKMVWFIADEMYEAAEREGRAYPSRKDVQAECVKRGIASGTARTQFQHWFKCRNESAQAPRATIGDDGKIVPVN